MNDKIDTSNVLRTVPFLACRWVQNGRLSLWPFAWPARFAASLLLVLAISEHAKAGVSVALPQALQADFIAQTTAQWNAEVKPGLFSSDAKLVITSKKDTPIPQPIMTASAMDACLAHGVGDGMEFEREADVDLIYGVQAGDALNRKCGGISVDLLTSTTTVMGACLQTYHNAASTINVRWGQVFDAEGKLIP